MSWVILFIAGVFEVGWAIGLKYTHGFTQLGASLATIASMAVSLTLLALALRTLPLATAYATWTGIGIIGSALASVLLFREPLDVRHFACITLIAAGITGLKLLT
jgi:quaternary ammonium compound-resistance protein SugE